MNNQTKSLNESRLAVIEGKWYPTKKSGRNTSIREIFDLLCNLRYGDAQSYHYEMFNDKHAFNEITKRLIQQNGIHYIYVASHGSEDGIQGSNGEIISLQQIIKAVSANAEDRGKLNGLYFGGCLFGQNESLKKLLQEEKNKAWWVAGYGKSVDFVNSTALDMMFWNFYLNVKGTPLTRIQKTCEWLNSRVSGLLKELDFRVYCSDERTIDSTKKLIG